MIKTKTLISSFTALIIMTTSSLASENAPTRDEVTKLYVATFNRAPDSAGINYWLNDSFGGNPTLSAIGSSFFVQPETQALYPPNTTNASFVTSIYSNLFNRAPDTAGLNYWVAELDNQTISKNRMIEAIINGATNTSVSNDKNILANKTTAGVSFAEAGLNDKNAARALLSAITDKTASLTAALASQNIALVTTEGTNLEALRTYASIALANYTDALLDAQALNAAIDTFVANPDADKLEATKTAWKKARVSYGTTEIFRLSNGPIDAEDGFGASFGAPEGQLNAWPLDENMIDYTTDASWNVTSGNIIDSTGDFTPSGSEATTVDITTITKEVLVALNENGGDANVATGYHAVEFLLWGQDQDYENFLEDKITNGATTAGLRDVSDFISAAHADRRKDYLVAASELIVDDLQTMVDAWTDTPGSYVEAFLGRGDNAIDTNQALKQVLSGMGKFVKSELSNERIAVALLTPSEEDEHSCFSDYTHVDIDTNYRGFVNVLKGEYKGIAQGNSFYSLLSAPTKESLNTLTTGLDARITSMNDAVSSFHFDYQLRDGNEHKSNLIGMKNELRDLGDAVVNVASDLGISLTEDDVTDPEETPL